MCYNLHSILPNIQGETRAKSAPWAAGAAGSEWSAVCPDDRGVYRFRRGYGGGTSGRRRLTAIKRAIYKSNNNRQVAIAA